MKDALGPLSLVRGRLLAGQANEGRDTRIADLLVLPADLVPVLQGAQRAFQDLAFEPLR
jgi:hypothetical protein